MFIAHRVAQQLARELGETLQRLRVERGLTQSAVAEAIGVDTVTVRRWEIGNRRPSPQNLKAIASLFKTTPDDLLLDAMEVVMGRKGRPVA